MPNIVAVTFLILRQAEFDGGRQRRRWKRSTGEPARALPPVADDASEVRARRHQITGGQSCVLPAASCADSAQRRAGDADIEAVARPFSVRSSTRTLLFCTSTIANRADSP
jgi:hypothetical protein